MCRPNTISHHSKWLRKTTYVHHHRWLQRNHPYQTNVRDFNGKSGRSPPPPIMLGFDVLLQANLFETWKLKGGKEEDNPSQQSGVKCKSCLHDLSLWHVSFVNLIGLIWIFTTWMMLDLQNFDWSLQYVLLSWLQCPFLTWYWGCLLFEGKIIAPKEENHDYHMMNSIILIDLKDLKYHCWFDLCLMPNANIQNFINFLTLHIT